MNYLKNICCLFVAILFLSVPTQAQKVKMTSPERLSNDITHFDILGKVNGNVLLYKYGRNYFEVNAFDSKSLDLSWSKEIRFKSKRMNMLEMILTKQGALAFYSERQNGQHNLKVQPLDKQFRLKGEPLLVNESDNKGIIYRINHSANRDYFAIEIIDKEGINNQNIEIVLMDVNMQKNNAVQIVNENNWRFRQTHIGLNGEVFLISDKRQTGLFSDEGLTKGIKINKLIDGVLTEQVIKHRDTLIAGYETELDLINNLLLVSGTYSTGNDRIPKGYFFSKVSFDDSALDISYAKLPELLKTQTTRRSLLGQKTRLDELEFRKVIPRSDGGALLIGELYNRSVVSNSTTGNIHTDLFAGRSAQTESYSYDDMVVLSIEPDGSLEWSDVMRKSQYSEDDDGHFSSFGVMNLKNRIHLIFNEQVEYITPVSSFGVSEQGSGGIKTLFNSEKYDILMSPRHAKQVGKNEMIIPAYTTRNYFVLVQLTY